MAGIKDSSMDTRAEGIAGAFAMFEEMEEDCTLLGQCDLDADQTDEVPPGTTVRNFLMEQIQDRLADRAYLQGFCEVLTGYLAMTVGGGVPDSGQLQAIFAARETRNHAALSEGLHHG